MIDRDDLRAIGQVAMLLLALVVSVVTLAVGLGLAAKVFSVLSGFP